MYHAGKSLGIEKTWNPLKILLGAYLFGGVEALTFRLQTIGVTVSPFFLQMTPYITTIIVLLFVVIRKRRGSGMPAALGLPYDRETS